MDLNLPITFHRCRLLDLLSMNICFLRGLLRWFSSKTQNRWLNRVIMLLKSHLNYLIIFWSDIMWFQKISIPFPWRFFFLVWTLSSHLFGNFVFWLLRPPPSEISTNPIWGGYEYFLEPCTWHAWQPSLTNSSKWFYLHDVKWYPV